MSIFAQLQRRMLALLPASITKLQQKDQRDFVSLSLALLTVLLFWRVGQFDFINFDDPQYVYENPQVAGGMTLENILWAFSTLHGGISYWHPVTWLSHQLDCQLFGLQAGRHHLTSLLLHIVNSILLFLVLFRMTGAMARSGLVAALFSVHPLHVESVVWIAERKDLLSCFFWLLTIWTYARYVENRRTRDYALALAFFALGLMSKPMVVTLPCVLLLMDFWPLKRIQLQPGQSAMLKSTLAKLALEKAPFFALAVLSGLLTIWAQETVGATASFETAPLSDRVENGLLSYCLYLIKTIWPVNLAVLYPFRAGLPPWQVTASGVALAAVTVIFWRKRKTKPYLIVGWLWFIVTLAPVIGIIKVGPQAMADRYTYIPLIGLFIAVVWGLMEFIPAGLRWVRCSVPAVTVLCLSAGTFLQLGYWKNSETLYERTLRLIPNNPVVRNNLGLELYRKNELPEARFHFQKALEDSPNLVQARVNLGNVCLKTGEYESALGHYANALRVDPRNASAQVGSALVLERQGKIKEAIDSYTAALMLDPQLLPACMSLARIFSRHAESAYRNGTNALFYAERACQLTAYNRADCLDLLAAAYAEAGRFDDAINVAQRALTLSFGNEELTRKIDASLSSYRSRVRDQNGKGVFATP